MLSKTHGRYLLLQQITKVGSGRELNVCMAGFSLLPRPLCFFNSCDFLWYWLVAVICWYCYCCRRCCGWPLHLLTITRNYFCLSLTHAHVRSLFSCLFMYTNVFLYHFTRDFHQYSIFTWLGSMFIHEWFDAFSGRFIRFSSNEKYLFRSFLSLLSTRFQFQADFFFFNCLLFILPTVFTHFAYDFLSLVWVLNFNLLSVWLLQCFIWLSFSSRREWNEWKPKCARHAMQNEVLAIYWALWDIVQQQGQLQAFIHFWNCFFKRNKQKLMRNNQGKKRHFLKAQLQSKLKLDASSSYLLETLTSHFSPAYNLFEAERSPTEDNKKQYRANFSHEN